jgi:acyl-CoA reductase-like NAD-dependent aldehyde dehydrogenase
LDSKSTIEALQAILHGRWGVVPASEHQEILVALASLIRAQRYEMALTIVNNEVARSVLETGLDIIARQDNE